MVQDKDRGSTEGRALSSVVSSVCLLQPGQMLHLGAKMLKNLLHGRRLARCCRMASRKWQLWERSFLLRSLMRRYGVIRACNSQSPLTNDVNPTVLSCLQEGLEYAQQLHVFVPLLCEAVSSNRAGAPSGQEAKSAVNDPLTIPCLQALQAVVRFGCAYCCCLYFQVYMHGHES